jgi:hypothetical protein
MLDLRLDPSERHGGAPPRRPSRLEPESAAKPHKRILITPNPIAGRSVQIGSTPGPVFDRGRWPQTLRDRLKDPAAQPQHPSIGERLACHFEHPSFEPAPPLSLSLSFSSMPAPSNGRRLPCWLTENLNEASLFRAGTHNGCFCS